MEEEEILEEIPKSLAYRVYHAAKEGMAITICALLADKPNWANSLINRKVIDENGECTPFVIAARYGHDKVIQLMIDKFKPNLEQEGTVEVSGTTVMGASALWCAAAAGHLSVVKTLVKAGADVNHLTKSKSTPLRAACFVGRLDIVKYLIEHNADMNIGNNKNNTCLMAAAYNGYMDIVQLLLEKGCDIHKETDCGDTALHFAAESGHTSIVNELLKYGAKMTKDMYGMTPLITAAEQAKLEVVEFLLKHTKVSKEETIEAYELVGASFANVSCSNPLAKTYTYLRKAMDLRYSDSTNIIRKKLREPVKAYDDWQECQTIDQLKAIKFNTNSLHMESLAVRERILGERNPKISNHLFVRGGIFADEFSKFDKCIDLWLRATELDQQNNVLIAKDIGQFLETFAQMIYENIDLNITKVLSVLKIAVTELTNQKLKIENAESKEEVDELYEQIEPNIASALFILLMLTKLTPKMSKYQIEETHYWAYKLCSLQLRLRDGQTLLHLAVNSRMYMKDVYENFCRFPCPDTVSLLVNCGADVNAMDNERNTPLHVVVSDKPRFANASTIYSIVTKLIEVGAHVDIMNKFGHTPYTAALACCTFSGEWIPILNAFRTKISLQCKAAKVIVAHNLPYHERVPRLLENFIELHGPGCGY